ncbi:MAG: FAD-binding protein, partial [Dehalococcoidia bacterium]
IPADTVHVAEDERLGDHNPEAVAAALAEIVRQEQPPVFLLAATAVGNEIATRLAASLGTGLASGCLRIDTIADGLLAMLRPVYGGRASCTVVCRTLRPQIATLLPDALSAGGGGQTPEPEVRTHTLRLEGFRQGRFVRRIERPPPASLDVTQAEVVVAGGRGVGGVEGFQFLEELAGLLGGAVAASRPAVDAGWAASSRQIGSSGKVVAPQLYIACGISGATQHVFGMRESEAVVTINQDAYAPITEMAQLALVGNVHEVLPPLLERLRQLPRPPAFEEFDSPLPPAPDGGAGDESVSTIAVCLSRSLDAEVRFDARNPEEMAAVPRVMGPADLHALEEALILKDRIPSLRVVALHAGPPVGEDVLRQALAHGADDAVLLWDEAFVGSDSLATARVLAAAVRRLEAQMVLCGSRGADGSSGQLPLQLGELLGATAMSEVLSLSLSGGGIVVANKRLEWGKQAMVDCLLPAVLAVEPAINRPRYPKLRDLLAASHRPVSRWDRAELGLAEDEVGAAGSGVEVTRVGPPKPVTKRAQPSSSQGAAWQQPMGGGGSSRDEKVVQGSPDELAERCFRFLLERGFVEEDGNA